MRIKSLFAAALCGGVIAAVGAGSAFAGEVTGNGKETAMKGHANSVCGFSGLEDDARSPIRTQTPHEVWLSKEEFPFVPEGGLVVNPTPGEPGMACNGHLNSAK